MLVRYYAIVVILSFAVLVWPLKDSSTNTSDDPTTNATTSPSQQRLDNHKLKEDESQLLAYRKLFALRRGQQTDALIAISKFKTYTKQYKMAEAMIQKIFEVLFESKAVIIDTGYIPEMAFPKDEKIRDAISKIYENTAFFGEIALRLPDITHKIYDRKTEWRYAIHWSVGFCNDSVSIFHGPHKKLLNLMSQELKLIPRDANYVNPYSKKESDREKMNKEQLDHKLKSKAQSSKSKSRYKKNKRKKRKSKKTEL